MTPRRQATLVLLAIVVAALLAYAPAIIEGGYIWDDDDYVTENELLAADDGLRRIWLEPSASPQYYPLVFTSFRLEIALLGGGPLVHHLTNVLLHALNAFLLFLLLRAFGLRGALLTALLFALHPVHVESVAWITERKNVLSGFFGLLALLLFVRADRRPRLVGGLYGLSLVCFLLALFSKTVVATLAPSLLVLAWWRRGRIDKRDWLLAAPYLVLGITGGIVTAVTEVAGVQASGPEWDLNVLERVLIAGRAIVFYAGKLFWPDPLSFNYPRWDVDPASIWQWTAPLMVLALMGVLVTAAVRGRLGRGPATALLLFAGNLFPALGFLNVYPMRYSFVADHFQYLASIVLLAPVGHHLAGLAIDRRRLPLLALLLLALGGLTYRQCRIYESPEVLWRDTVAKNPSSFLAWNNLGGLALGKGDPEEARRCFARAFDAAPGAREVLNNLGTMAADLDDDPEVAIDFFRRALAADPRYQDARVNLALMLVRSGRPAEALVECDAALAEAARLEKEYPMARWIRARALHESGRHAEALVEIDRALEFLGLDQEAVALRTAILTALDRPGDR